MSQVVKSIYIRIRPRYIRMSCTCRLKDCPSPWHLPVPPCLGGRLPSTELQHTTNDTMKATVTTATATTHNQWHNEGNCHHSHNTQPMTQWRQLSPQPQLQHRTNDTMKTTVTTATATTQNQWHNEGNCHHSHSYNTEPMTQWRQLSPQPQYRTNDTMKTTVTTATATTQNQWHNESNCHHSHRYNTEPMTQWRQLSPQPQLYAGSHFCQSHIGFFWRHKDVNWSTYIITCQLRCVLCYKAQTNIYTHFQGMTDNIYDFWRPFLVFYC